MKPKQIKEVWGSYDRDIYNQALKDVEKLIDKDLRTIIEMKNKLPEEEKWIHMEVELVRLKQ